MWVRAPSMDDYANNIDIDIVEYDELVVVAVEGEVDLYGACSTSPACAATSRSCASRHRHTTPARRRRVCVSRDPEGLAPHSSSRASFSVALGRIAAATFSMSGR